MLDELKGARLLRGYRGASQQDVAERRFIGRWDFPRTVGNPPRADAYRARRHA